MKRALIATALLVAATPAHANPVDMFGFGARAAAMAGAQTASADGAATTYYNPARMAGGDDTRIDVGYQVGLPTLDVDGRDVNVDDSRGTTLGLVVPGVVAGKRVAIGAATFLPDQHLTRTRSLPSPRPRFALYDNRPQRLYLSADLAIELLPGLRLGAGIAYMSGTQGRVDLRGTVGLADPGDSQLELSIDVDLKTVRYPHAGLAWQATPWLDLGVSYRGGFTLNVVQVVRIEGDIGTPGEPPAVDDAFLDLDSRSQDLFQPVQITAGAAARVTPATLIAFDLGWHRWSAFNNPAARIVLDLDIKQFNEFVELPPALPLPLPHYHDIVVPRLGVEHTLARGQRRLDVRGGYAYEPTPAPEQWGETNFIDSDRHTASLGAGLELPHLGAIIPRPVSFDAYAALTLLAARDHQKLSPVDPVGDYRSSGHVIAAGLSSRWRF